MIVRVDLQQGFQGEFVVVRVNGAEILRKEDVRTRPEVGLAETAAAPLEGNTVTLEVLLPERRISDRLEIAALRTIYVGVNLGPDGGLSYTIQYQPFRYV